MMKSIASLIFYGRFARHFSAHGYRQAKKHWPETGFDFSGQTWLVTGASAGIGRAIVLEANRFGATVIAVARNPNALEDLKKSAVDESRLQTVVCDLSSMAAIESLCQSPELSGVTIDVLVNNVGVLLNEHVTTSEGFDCALATNLLGSVLLTEQCFKQGMLACRSSVINVSSGGMYGTPLKIDAMAHPPKPYDGVAAYAMHKRAQVTWTHHWNQLHPEGPAMYVMHPGWVDTPGVQQSLPAFRAMMRPILRTREQGADTVLWLASHRPKVAKEGIWLDRENQTEHAFSFTKRSKEGPLELQAYLHQTLAPWQ